MIHAPDTFAWWLTKYVNRFPHSAWYSFVGPSRVTWWDRQAVSGWARWRGIGQ